MPTKVICSIQELKKDERRGTMDECAAKKQIRYFGMKKVDKVIIDKLTTKKIQMSKRNFAETMGKLNGLKTKAKKLFEQIKLKKENGDVTKLKQLEKDFEKAKAAYARLVPTAKKMMAEQEKIEATRRKQEEEKEKKQLKEKQKKTSKKSSKKTTKK